VPFSGIEPHSHPLTNGRKELAPKRPTRRAWITV
jgi:hypothetical protein